MVRNTFKILQHLLQDFKSVSDHFGTLCIKELRTIILSSLVLVQLSNFFTCKRSQKTSGLFLAKHRQSTDQTRLKL